jgi:glucose-1-phosphate thymidylyltransferase
MNIIVPMAGMGKRMRPHTLTIPKPLIPVVGKPIVQRLVEDIAEVCGNDINEIAFIIGDFGKEVEESLLKIADSLGAKGKICYQEEALGTAHAIYCAKESLNGPVIVAFADTLFTADFKLDQSKDGIIWVKQIENPEAFGVVKLDKEGTITDFVEKPETFVSDLAIIGIYFFTKGEILEKEIKYLLDNNIKDKGEFQLTNALENMKSKGMKFGAGSVNEWLDCGNKDATVYTNQRVLELKKKTEPLRGSNVVVRNSTVIEPCFLGDNVLIENSVIGPHVSIGKNSKVMSSIISNTIVQTNTELHNINCKDSMIGNHTKVVNEQQDLSIGDYIQIA